MTSLPILQIDLSVLNLIFSYFYFPVLARVKEFLPEMQQAQQDLQKHLDTQPASSVDIEEVTDGERHIEMVRGNEGTNGVLFLQILPIYMIYAP